MSETVIRIEHLSKQYRLGVISHRALYKDIQSWWAKSRGREDPNRLVDFNNLTQTTDTGDDKFLALNDISFDVKKGDIIGIIGKNGAGKSTLLKILSRVTSPTSGLVKVKGRIASLLEVGTGFHPELTGRENIYLNGAILGMTKSEVNKKLDEIVDFAGISKFINTPVKRFSSGMYVRLAFAVAAHLEPEILLVDEVLAVGDAEFQKKCLGKMKDVAGEGRTVLFVSHNMSSIRSLCSRGILLAQGKMILNSSIHNTIEKYTKLSSAIVKHNIEGIYKDTIKLNKIALVDEHLKEIKRAEINQKIGIWVDFEIIADTPYKPDIFISVYTLDGCLAFSTCIETNRANYDKCPKQLVCWIEPNFLNATSYSLRISCTDLRKNFIYFSHIDAIVFDVEENINNRSISYRGDWLGALRPKINWEYVNIS